LFSIALASGLALSVAACATPAEPATAPDTTASDSAPTTEEAPADAATETECHSGSVSTGALPAGLPEGFPNIGVPFYSGTTLMAATGDGDPYVLEYQSADEQATVNTFIADTLVENCWELLETTTEGTMSVNKAWTPGYSLVIAIGPDRVDEALTGIHYTLREQQEP
jgi:hypothetical protein